jgi:micrococcal nuclease
MYEYKCIIVNIVDGDTVDVDISLGFDIWLFKKRIRLYNIDTPECRTRDLEEKKYGLLAKEFVQNALPVGSTQTLITILDKNEKYGRILGKIKLADGSIINNLLVSNYLAVEYNGESKEKIIQQHLNNRLYLNLV